jgi:hypothetical protein
LIEHFLGKEEVVGLNPTSSSMGGRMALDHTIAAFQAAFMSDDPVQVTEAQEALTDPAIRRELLETHGIDTTSMSDDEVSDSLLINSRDGLD